MLKIEIQTNYGSRLLPYTIPGEGYITHHSTGSYYICNPPVEDTDIDILILVKDREEYQSNLFKDDWKGCTGYEDKELHFFAARKGKYNLIVTDEVKWYTKFAAATELAKYMNLTDKKLRIELFELVLDEEKVDEALKTFAIGKAVASGTISTSGFSKALWPGIEKYMKGF